MSTIQQTCNQRILFFSSINKGPRFTPVSPYPAFTKPALDMRRKAEILQYSQQSNNFTKNKKWSILTKQAAINNRRICLYPNQSIKIPSTSSDVPGPPILLYNDPNVPLYMYSDGQNVDNQLNSVAYTNLKENWTIYTITDALVQNKTKTSLGNLVILYPAYSAYSFSLKTPISLSISGIKQPVGIFSSTAKIISTITSATLNVYYSEMEILTIPLDVTNLSSMTITFDDTPSAFQAYQYIGDILAENIELNTISQYVYTFYLVLGISYIQYDSFGNILTTETSNISNINNSVIANISDVGDPYYYSYENCMITTPPLSIDVLPLTIDGTPIGTQCGI